MLTAMHGLSGLFGCFLRVFGLNMFVGANFAALNQEFPKDLEACHVIVEVLCYLAISIADLTEVFECGVWRLFKMV